MEISSWWDALSSLQKIHWAIALPSTTIFVIQLIISLTAGVDSDLDTSADHNGDFSGDQDAGMHIFSVKSILAFLMFYGWGGLAAIDRGMHVWWGVSGISLALGLIMMLFTAWIFFMLLKLQSSGTLVMENALGKEAEVYLTIPAKKKGNGKVQIIIQEGYKTLDAVTEDTEDIKTGSFVEVIEVVNDTLVVKRKR
ncbi:MAG: NfeD family protein [Bacteroidales bacterium]|nr:NfeD family protein [Bacteroidales bacterium]